MPKIYRVMKMIEGKPIVDATGKGLGVRGVPINGVADVDFDDEGRVVLNGKGMSVVPAWRDLPYFLVPRRLRNKYPLAQGSSATSCFTMGEGPFEDGAITTTLELKKDRPTHGNIAPARSVSLDEFGADLAATRDLWTIDEE